MDFCPFSHRFELCSRVNNLRHGHIYKTHRVTRVCPEPGNFQGTRIGCFLSVHTIGHDLDPKDRVGKWEKVNSAQYHRTLTRGPATSCIGFRASEGQPKVRRLIASAVVDIRLNTFVESCILRAGCMSSNSLPCDIFATLTQEIVTCPSCRLAVSCCSCAI